MLRRFVKTHDLWGFSKRALTTYDSKPLSHDELLRLHPRKTEEVISPHQFAENSLIPALEAVEERVAMWRLNRWELRIPALLAGAEKERAQQQLLQIRTHMSQQCQIFENSAEDKALLVRSLGLKDASELTGKSRAWLQEKVDALRWEGRVSEAKTARDAWIRLEKYGNRDYRLLERVCAIYGMGRMNTFGEAFTHFVSEDPVTRKLMLESIDPFSKSLSLIMSSMPTVDVCYDFLGLGANGYTSALKKYLRYALFASRQSPSAAKLATEGAAAGRMLYSSPSEVLFDLTQVNSDLESSNEVFHSSGDLLFVSGSKVTLISVASPNRHVRSLQVPSRRQLEGIARRLCISLDVPVNEIQVQFLYLPPSAMDTASLDRLHRMLGLDQARDLLAEKGIIPEWAGLFDRELSAAEVDYVSLQKKFPEEEWVML